VTFNVVFYKTITCVFMPLSSSSLSPLNFELSQGFTACLSYLLISFLAIFRLNTLVDYITFLSFNYSYFPLYPSGPQSLSLLAPTLCPYPSLLSAYFYVSISLQQRSDTAPCLKWIRRSNVSFCIIVASTTYDTVSGLNSLWIFKGRWMQ
jgi:hypothetical protein